MSIRISKEHIMEEVMKTRVPVLSIYGLPQCTGVLLLLLAVAHKCVVWCCFHGRSVDGGMAGVHGIHGTLRVLKL